MFTLKELTLKKVCINTAKQLPHKIKLELIERYGSKINSADIVAYFRKHFTESNMDSILIAPFIYLELTDRYTAVEKDTVINHLFDQA